jgi:predicted RNA-binding Zn ribbon-like protein
MRNSEVALLVGGGAPQRGEPLPIELANTTFMARGALQDGLQSAEHVGAWLRDVRSRLATPIPDAALLRIRAREVAAVRELRDCLRSVATAVAAGQKPRLGSIRLLNRYARSASQWRELRWDDAPRAETRIAAPAVVAALAEIAQQGVDLFAGADRARVRACQATGCVLLFLLDHPRREWCCVGCGNRVRAARHYARIKSGRGSGPSRSG